MDQKMLANLLCNSTQITTNIFVLGGKNVGKTTLITEVQNFLNLNLRKQRLDEFENDVYSNKFDRSNLVYNFYEVKNIVLFKQFDKNFLNCSRNIVIVVYEILNDRTEEFILKIKEIINDYYILCDIHMIKMRNCNDEIKVNLKFAEFSGVKIYEKPFDKSVYKLIFNNPEHSIEEYSYIKKPKQKKKIFHIVKVQQNKKILKNKITLKKMKSQNSDWNSNINSNKKSKVSTKLMDEDENSKEDINNKNSLITISREVFEFIKSKGEVSGQSVTVYMQNQINKKNVEISYKNIQRRVYDAINVISAVGLISKKKSNLVYDGVFQILESISLNKIDELKEKRNSLRKNINYLQHILLALVCKNYMSQKLIEDNTTNIKRRNCIDKINYPFLLIKLSPDACFTIKEDDTNSRVCIFSEKQFSIIKDEDIMKDVLKNDDKMRVNLKKKIKNEVCEYIQKHNLLEKYFLNFSQFNSFNYNSLNETIDFHSLKKNSVSSFDSENYRKNSFVNFERNLIRSFDKLEELGEKGDKDKINFE